MGYIGSKPANNFETVRKQVSTSNSGTTITLDYPVTSVADILLTINAVVQSYDNYSVSGSTLTVGGTLNNDRVEILFVGRTYGSTAPTDASVGTSALQDDAVTAAKLSSTAVDNTNINSTLITAQTEKSSLVDADKFLISDSAASGALKYVQKSNLPSGGLVPVTQSSGTSGTANVIVNGWITDTYENYVMDYYFNVATSGEAVSMTLYDSSGNISSGNNYDWSHIGIDGSDGSTETLYNSGQNAFRLCHGANNDSARLSVTGRLIWLHPRLSGKRTTILHSMRQLNTSAQTWTFNRALEFKGTNQLTGFYCNSTSGNIDNWGIRCYGIVNS